MLYAAARKELPRGGTFILPYRGNAPATVNRKLYFSISGNVCIFAPTFESESCKQEKHCNTVLIYKFAKFKAGGRALMLSLVCVCYITSAYRQA